RFSRDWSSDVCSSDLVRYGVGVDSIDLAAARRRGIAVARVCDYGAEAVAFHAVAMAAAQLRRLAEADRAVRAGGWGFAGLRPMPGRKSVGEGKGGGRR